MMKYQENVAAELAQAWLAGKREYVRTSIRNLSAQAAFLAASVTAILCGGDEAEEAVAFVDYLRPDESGATLGNGTYTKEPWFAHEGGDAVESTHPHPASHEGEP